MSGSLLVRPGAAAPGREGAALRNDCRGLRPRRCFTALDPTRGPGLQPGAVSNDLSVFAPKPRALPAARRTLPAKRARPTARPAQILPTRFQPSPNAGRLAVVLLLIEDVADELPQSLMVRGVNREAALPPEFGALRNVPMHPQRAPRLQVPNEIAQRERWRPGNEQVHMLRDTACADQPRFSAMRNRGEFLEQLHAPLGFDPCPPILRRPDHMRPHSCERVSHAGEWGARTFPP